MIFLNHLFRIREPKSNISYFSFNIYSVFLIEVDNIELNVIELVF